jgi:hypothetical protein
MKNKFTDKELMAFADGELKGGKAMDVLSAILEDTPEAEALQKRLEVFTSTRRALLNSLIAPK